MVVDGNARMESRTGQVDVYAIPKGVRSVSAVAADVGRWLRMADGYVSLRLRGVGMRCTHFAIRVVQIQDGDIVA